MISGSRGKDTLSHTLTWRRFQRPSQKGVKNRLFRTDAHQCSPVQVEASISRHGEPRVDMEASTSGTHQDEENEEVHQDEHQQPPSPPRQENDNVNNEEGQEEEQDEEEVQPRTKQKLSRVRERISKDIPLSKSIMISKPGESLALKLVWLTFVNIIHSSLVLNL